MNRDSAEPGPLRDVLAQILIENSNVGEPRNTQDFLHLVRGALTLRSEADRLLHTAVVSARDVGATWQNIGSTLGMTKQAAQKRFAPPSARGSATLDAKERTIGPTTSFNEMHELALAGSYGWHSVDFGATHHRVIHSDTQWEHLRVTISPGKISTLVADGWLLIGSSFPYTYLKRDTGIPALLEEPSP